MGPRSGSSQQRYLRSWSHFRPGWPSRPTGLTEMREGIGDDHGAMQNHPGRHCQSLFGAGVTFGASRCGFSHHRVDGWMCLERPRSRTHCGHAVIHHDRESNDGRNSRPQTDRSHQLRRCTSTARIRMRIPCRRTQLVRSASHRRTDPSATRPWRNSNSRVLRYQNRRSLRRYDCQPRILRHTIYSSDRVQIGTSSRSLEGLFDQPTRLHRLTNVRPPPPPRTRSGTKLNRHANPEPVTMPPHRTDRVHRFHRPALTGATRLRG